MFNQKLHSSKIQYLKFRSSLSQYHDHSKLNKKFSIETHEGTITASLKILVNFQRSQTHRRGKIFQNRINLTQITFHATFLMPNPIVEAILLKP